MKRIHIVLCLVLCALLALPLSACGGKQGRTDRFDGYTVRTERSAPVEQAEETTVPDRALPGETGEDYVLNRKSMKFHYPDCSGAKEIKEQNRWDYHGTRAEVIDMGYAPCKICNP
jgi:hypothetical protein